MRIVKQSCRLFGEYDWNGIKRHLASAGGVCYNKPKKTPEEISKFLRRIKDLGHLSVLEHCNVSFEIITSRSMLAQITRHRHMSFSVQSQRYCNYSKGTFGNQISFIEPENTRMYFREMWKTQMKLAENCYLAMIENGIPPEDAREVLPNSTATKLIMTGNIRAWKEYLSLRLGHGTQKQHKELAKMIHMILSTYLPEIFD